MYDLILIVDYISESPEKVCMQFLFACFWYNQILTRTRKFVDLTISSNVVQKDCFDSTDLSKRDENCAR